MKARHACGHYINLIQLFGVTTLFSVLFFGANTVSAQCGAVNCTGVTGSGKTCTATGITAFCFNGGVTSGSSIVVTMSANANCSAFGNTGIASHLASLPASATCGFRFQKSCTSMTTFMTTYSTFSFTFPGLPASTFCTINMADGLPVELMGFEIIE